MFCSVRVNDLSFFSFLLCFLCAAVNGRRAPPIKPGVNVVLKAPSNLRFDCERPILLLKKNNYSLSNVRL